MERKMRGKGRDNVSLENGDCLSKMPTATAEQLTIAKMLSKPGDEVDLRSYVAQLQELTECTEDQAATALYDCENNLERAVELVLDKFRCGDDEEWHTTGRKMRSKPVAGDSDSATTEARSDKGPQQDEPNRNSGIGSSHDADAFNSKEGRHTDSFKSGKVETWSGPARRDVRGRKSATVGKGAGSANGDRKHDRDGPACATEQASGSDQAELNHKTKSKASRETDGWDPYTEYGDWTGEAIEVVNSNASIEKWCSEESNLPEELFVDTEHAANKNSVEENPPTSSTPSVNTMASPNLSTLPDVDSLFISKANSKQPPPAFTHLPDVPVFVVPDLIPRVPSRWMFKFGGEAISPMKPSDSSLLPSMHTVKEASCTGLTQSCFTKTRTDQESQEFSSYAPQSPSKSPVMGFDVNKPTTPRSLLEDPSRPEAKAEQVPSTFTTAHFQTATSVPKTTTAFSSNTKTQSASNFESEGGANQSTFLEPSFKNYILDGLSNEVNKLAVGESSNSGVKSSQFNLQQPVSQVPQTQPSFSHNQVGISNQMGKAPLSHISNHSALHTSQQSIASSAQSQQTPVTLPPGMPHFISQFAPPTYHMFNLPGSSSNAQALFDFDHLQLLQQQQRMLYDMHLQHQAATTAQSLLPSSADSTSTSKSSSHNVTGSMGHLAATSAGIRPDMLASAIGHAPQMLTPGHPYFSYPGLVFMQQQPTGQDTNQSQSSTHCGSPITQHQAQSSGQPQSFGGMKQVNAGVGGYEDLLDMKYGDPSKQVGFKNSANQPNYGSFQTGGSSEAVGPKLPGPHQPSAGPLSQGGYNAASGGAHTQHFPPQFYPPTAASPYLTAAAVAVAAAAAASAQQQQQQASVGGGPATTANMNQSNTNAGGGSNTTSQAGSAGGASGQLHLANNPGQPLVLGASGGGLHHHPHHHHQRSVMPH